MFNAYSVCKNKSPPIRLDNLNFFDVIAINVVDNLEFLPATAQEKGGLAHLTYAGYLDYILEKRGTEQVKMLADGTITTLSLALGVGEVALLLRAGNTTARIALASIDLGSELADLVIHSELFAQLICPGIQSNDPDCPALRNIKLGNLLFQLSAIGASGIDIATNWDALKSARRINALSVLSELRKKPPFSSWGATNLGAIYP